MPKAGFINIIGLPNAGKSTLMNALVGENLSIITPKAQTTRHRILGIVETPDHQMIFSDTPGLLDPGYKMQESMMKFVYTALSDADIILYLIDVSGPVQIPDKILAKLQKSSIPVIGVFNKVDLIKQDVLDDKIKEWERILPSRPVYTISALAKFGTRELLRKIETMLPESHFYYEPGQLTDKPEKFFVSEIIREKILLYYEKEIPYSSEVAVMSFEEGEELVKINAEIYVMRESQKAIIIGHRGSSLKKTGTAARKDIEKFLGKKVFLQLFVKVKKDWRDNERMLKHFGYES